MSYNPYKKYSSYWWRFWLRLPHDIFVFIVRMRDYAPLIWEDRDWDYSSLLHIMRFKIRRMRDCIGGNSLTAHCEDNVAEMAKADVLLRNVIEEDPDDEWSQHYSQWDSHIKAFKDCKNQREHRRSLNLSHLREERNWRALWRHMDKYLRGWWD